MLLCEQMEDHESILISGAEQFSTYTGYGSKFKYTGPCVDPNPIDEKNRRCVSIVAIDAIPFSLGGGLQYNKPDIVRELNKAYSGFSFTVAGDTASSGKKVPIATGNWGCGAFGGDKELKTLIQWMAATKVGRPVHYYTFSDRHLTVRQEEVVKCLQELRVTVGQLYHILTTAHGKLPSGNAFKYVMKEASKLKQ